MREEQAQNAVKFLSHPKVRGSPVNFIYRISFLDYIEELMCGFIGELVMKIVMLLYLISYFMMYFRSVVLIYVIWPVFSLFKVGLFSVERVKTDNDRRQRRY